MILISFNANSIRTRIHQLEYIINTYSPEFIGIQETKVDDENFPREQIESLGYHVEFFGQKTHYGVALMSKSPFKHCQKGFPSDSDDEQKRFIAGNFILPNGEKLTVMNGYFPQGESREHPTKFPNKERYYADLIKYLNSTHSNSENIIVMGDMNVCPSDNDIGIGEDNKKRWLKTGKCSFLTEEQTWLQALINWGLIDTYRQIHPISSSDKTENKYSWFDYRSRGFDREPKRGLRIDFIFATKKIAQNCVASDIDYIARAMEKPSDHCPIWSEFSM